MSTCISREGEFGNHTLDDEHTCTRCHVLDEDALREELTSTREQLRLLREQREEQLEEIEDRANQRADAIRQSAINGFTEVRKVLLAALGREDDRRTQLVAYVADLTKERDLLRGQTLTLRGLCDAIARMPGYDPAEAYVTVAEIRRILDAAEQPCPAGCPHPYRSHEPDGCRARMGKCDVCACQEPGGDRVAAKPEGAFAVPAASVEPRMGSDVDPTKGKDQQNGSSPSPNPPREATA